MFSLLATAVSGAENASLDVALQWLPWVILIAAVVAAILAVLVKSIYLFLRIFSKKG